MKKTKYRVTFESGKAVEVSASGKNPAIILAQAEQIKQGFNWQVAKVEYFSRSSKDWIVQL